MIKREFVQNISRLCWSLRVSDAAVYPLLPSLSASDPVSGPQVLYMRILALQYTNTPVLNTVTNDSTHSYLREFLARGQSPSENLF